jgi:O-antigen ligase
VIKENHLNKLVYTALWIWVMAQFMSTSLLAGFHIFIIIPILFSLKEFSFKKMSRSQLVFFFFSIACLISVAVNQDIESRGFSPMTKVKYYLIAVLAVIPTQVAFDKFIDVEKRKKLFKAFLFFATLAGIAGLIALWSGVNPLTFKKACHLERNCGMAGMYMNYAHSLGYFMSAMLALLVFREEVKKYIDLKWIYLVFAFNLFAFYMTFTRGAWLGFLAAIPFAFIKKNKKLVLGGLLGMIIVGAMSFFFIPKVHDTFMNRQTSNDERVGSWRAAIKAFEERPVFGFGLLNFEPHSSELKVKYNLNNAYFKGHAHNIFLEFLATTGAVGFLLFISWLIFWFYEMYKRSDLVGVVMLPVIISFAVSGLTQSTFVLADNTFFITVFYLLSQIRFQQTS